MRVGARQGFAYNSVKLVLLANGNSHEIDFNTFFFSVIKRSIHLKSIDLSQLWTFLPHIIHIRSLCLCESNR
jgi:hypothetical protein